MSSAIFDTLDNATMHGASQGIGLLYQSGEIRFDFGSSRTHPQATQGVPRNPPEKDVRILKQSACSDSPLCDENRQIFEIVKRLDATIRQAHPPFLPLMKSLSSYERRAATGRRV